MLILIFSCIAQSTCVSSPYSAEYIANQSLLITESRAIRDERQFIFPDMTFKCNGTVEKWIYAGIGISETESELQIWRLTSGDTYVKVGFSPVKANETEPGSNIHESHSSTAIEFKEGDVFGLFQPNIGGNAITVYGQREHGPSNYRVNSNVNSPSSTLVLSNLRLEGANDFPLVTLNIISKQTLILITPFVYCWFLIIASAVDIEPSVSGIINYSV